MLTDTESNYSHDMQETYWSPSDLCQLHLCLEGEGIGGIIASTCMDQWSTQDLYNNPVTAVFNYQGLWRTCVRESSGFTECRGYFTILGLPGLNFSPASCHTLMVKGHTTLWRRCCVPEEYVPLGNGSE
ncbi:hypothetical protein AAES_163654 [Amazona aestiva]|uniref:Claudin n=1 Tax=Amazona aestiva TaxID=12930 RepID=A0A0Q3SZZ6_AMAAE|nr:hypothetical protein AAES_163654 [Amazona aestiva]